MPSLADILGISEFETEAFDKLGTDARIGSEVGVARGTNPGKVADVLQGRSNEELAGLDRLQFNRRLTKNNPIAGSIGAFGLAGGDVLKLLGIGQDGASQAAVKGAGFSEAGAAQFTNDENTSEASVGQILDNFKGAALGGNDFLQSLFSGEALKKKEDFVKTEPDPTVGFVRG